MCKKWVCLLAVAGVLSLATVTRADLIGWWTLDDGSGSVAKDSSGNGNDATFSGSPVWVTGQLGGALQFNGSSYLDCGNTTTLQVAGPITITCWVNPSVLSGDQSLASRTAEYAFKASGTNLRFTTPGVLDHTGSNSVLTLNTWQHVAATFIPGQSTNGLIFYINGAQTDQMTASSMSTGTGPFQIANNQWSEMFTGMIDDVQVYNEALSAEQIVKLMAGLQNGQATAPTPADQATDVVRDVALSWMAGEFAATHDVYFGTTFADVNDASRSNTMGVLVSQGQTAATYEPEAALEYGQTYYWRVDEVNAAPDNTIFKGETWSFTVETYGYQVTPVAATASSYQANMGPENTINGSGLNDADQHSVDLKQMWMTTGLDKPDWIQYEFDKVYTLYQMQVWNSNQAIESFLGFGAKNVTVEYSVDGETWTTLEGAPEFAKATGAATYVTNTTVDFAGVMAKFVKLTINTNWGGTVPQTGLSEVRFSYIPVEAFEPDPAEDATNVSLDATLNWRPGRMATSHEVYFSSDSEAVAQGTVSAQTVTDHRYTPAGMEYGVQYFWRVDEIGETDAYQGDVWSFTAQEFAPADDFESYDDDASRIYETWIDGLTTGASGSQVGYDEAPFAEKTIVHGGVQSMPLMYDNTTSPYYSEAEREFESAQNWTGNGASEVGVWIHGYPAVTAATVTETSGKMTLTGTGADIWGNSDEFFYAYKSLDGDGSMIARVVSNGTGASTWAKGGVMIRDSLDGGSSHAMMVMTGSGGNGASFQYRATTDSTSGNSDSSAVVAPPYWVKIVRADAMFTGYVSADGKNWTMIGSTTVTMTDPVYIGLCVTSTTTGEDRTYEFDNITSTGTIAGSWQGAVINSPQYNDPAGMYLTVKDSAGKSATATNATIATSADWTLWTIPMDSLTGVNLAKVVDVVIGVGDKNATTAGGTGIVFIDDLGYGCSAK